MSVMRHQGRAMYAFFERNWNLTKRYWGWELVWLVYNMVNALSVIFIPKAMGAIAGTDVNINVDYMTLYMVIGTSVWSYLSVTFEGVTDVIAIERWEGTIEHTFMAPIPRLTHMLGSCWYAIVHGLFFTVVQLLIISFFFHIDLSHANFFSALFILVLGSISFIGLGVISAILPLLYTERGSQMSAIVRAVFLMVSGVYYPVSILPQWVQFFSALSPVTYVLQGMRAALLENAPIWSPSIWNNTWPLLITGLVSIPMGLYFFGLAERYAKRTGKLKRNG